MKLYINNAFSLSMLDREAQISDQRPRIPRPIADPAATVREWQEAAAEIVSVLGHASTQGIFETVLGIQVPVNRKSIKLQDGEMMLIGQYIGPRLPEGATELPKGATLEWWII